MSKRVYRTYSAELKQKVVEEYLSGKGSLRYLAKLHQIGDKKVSENGSCAIMVIKSLNSARLGKGHSI